MKNIDRLQARIKDALNAYLEQYLDEARELEQLYLTCWAD